MFAIGDFVVYRAQKHSDHPTLKAQAVEPELHGEGYRYQVQKYWVVAATTADGQVDVVTRRGKLRRLHANDPMLRPAYWWEKLFFSSRFPALPTSVSPQSTGMEANSRAS